MTGSLPETSKSSYLKEIQAVISERHLESNVTFLGVIPRSEQLLLMKHALAVIQPSLFEGWSTVIEDARSLQVQVIASDIPVNIEQLGSDGFYFNPHSPSELASLMKDFHKPGSGANLYEDYHGRIKRTAKSFMGIFTEKS